MRPELAGALIRRARLEKNWSQEGLCRGICSVSWLSKIEAGREGADPELVAALFARLGMDMSERPGAAELIDRCYEAAFSLDYEGWDALNAELASARLENGPYCVDAELLGRLFSDERAVPDWLRAMEGALEPRQRSLLYWLSGDFEALCRFDGAAYSFYLCGYEAYCTGKNTLALELLERACRLASDKGRLRILMNARLTIGNCYSNSMQYEDMLRHYAAAERMARTLGDADTVRSIEYNRAATALELGRAQEAYDALTRLGAESAMELHKLAVACELLRKRDEALAALERAEDPTTPSPEPARELAPRICGLVRYRLEHPDYLERPEYGAELMELFETMRRELPIGYASFHLPRVLEWLRARRMYRQAYELLLDFPGCRALNKT